MTRELEPRYRNAQRKSRASVAVEMPTWRALRTMKRNGWPALYSRSTASMNGRCAHPKSPNSPAPKSSTRSRSRRRMSSPFVLMVRPDSQGRRERAIGLVALYHVGVYKLVLDRGVRAGDD